jgi:nucleoside-diphosphate-sugar epimerase
MNDKKLVLVTGATGVIGSHLTPRLLKEGYHVIAISRSESRLKEVFEPYIGTDSFEYAVIDVGEPFDIMSISQKKKKEPIDIVFHAASPTARDTIRDYPIEIIKPNIFGTKYILDRLIDQQKATGVKGRAVIFSSMAVYGLNPPSDIVVDESDVMYFDSLEHRNASYAESKRMVELITLAYVKQFGIDAVIVRPSGIYGNIMYPPETAFYEFIRKAILRQDIQIETNDIPKRDNIYIVDAISALLTILQHGKPGETYNISSGGDLENYAALDEIAGMIANISNEIFPDKINMSYRSPANVPRKPGILIKNDKLKALGWELKTSLADGIRAVLLEQSEAK